MKEGKLNELYQRLLDKLGVSWDPLADQWEQNFSLLEQFKEREGHCNVPESYEEDGVKLGVWLGNQRTAMKEGNHDESHQGRLERLGVSRDPLADQWEQNFALLEQYKEREEHCNVPQSHEEDGIMLGKWLARQRSAMKNGKLGESYQRRLEKLGMIWKPLEDQWEQKFSMLEQFKAREGHCDVPFFHEEGGVNLGSWLDSLRQIRKGNRVGNLSSERIERLNGVGMRW